MSVVLDPGHGGRDDLGRSTALGGCGPLGTREKDVTFDVAQRIAQLLGGDARVTRRGDENLSLAARAAQAAGAAVFVSIHANSGAPDREGPETFVHPDATRRSRALAAGILGALERRLGRDGRARPPHEGRMAVLSPQALDTGTSACLVELDYLSHPHGERRLRDPVGRHEMAEAIARAIRVHLAEPARLGRSTAKDDLGVAILELLWEKIEADDVPHMADRLRRLEEVLDAVHDYDAGDLLKRLEKGGDLQVDFDYRLSTPTRKRLRDKLRARARTRPGTTPSRSAPVVVKPKRQPDKPDKPKPTPTPTPDPYSTFTAVWEWVQAPKWEIKKARSKWFKTYFHFELEVEASVNATGQELVTFKSKWSDGIRPGGEIETAFQEWFVPDVEVEVDKGKVKVAVKKKLDFGNGALELEPHMQLGREFAKLEATTDWIPPFEHTFFGQKVKFKIKPKIVVSLELDIEGLIGRGIRTVLEEVGKRVLDDLLGLLGRKLLAGVTLELVLEALLGAVLVYLLLRDAPNQLVTAPPDDIQGKDTALDLAGTPSDTLVKDVQAAADDLRRQLAIGYAGAIIRLTQDGWRDHLDGDMKTKQVPYWKDLPDLDMAFAFEWKDWVPDERQRHLETVTLATDQARKRFRRYEHALVIAAAKHSLGLIGARSLELARDITYKQATVAGMAAAVQYVRRQIASHSDEYRDDKGKIHKRDGMDHWDAIAAGVRDSYSDPDEVSERLEPLGAAWL